MFLSELLKDELDVLETKMAWARRGNKTVRKFRCSMGRRKGRIVASPAQCFKAPDIKKRMVLKRTKAKMGGRLQKKRKRTMKTNAASRRMQALNK